MQDTLETSSVMVVRRKAKKLPSITRNVLRAFLVLLLVPFVVYALFQLSGNPKDAIATGEVAIDPVPLPPASDTLEGETEALPDLLSGIVPEEVNPTERLDALGNPIGTPSNPSNLAGGNDGTVRETIIPQPSVSGPRTILIDGKPLGGTAFYQSSPLVPAPLAGLTRPSPFGLVPTIAENGQKPVQAYARPFTPVAGKQPVSVIVGGLGIDRNLTRRIINELPPEVTLSFAAHTNGLQTWVNQARARGHEVLIELPMESESLDGNDPSSKYVLRADIDPSMNIRSLDWLMSRAQGYFAVTNYNGDKILKRADAMGPVLAHLSDAGIGFVFDGSANAASLSPLAKSADVPFNRAFNLLDGQPDSASIQTELARLQAQASAGGSPVGIGFAYPQTLDALKVWVQTLDADGLQLAPASFALGR